MLDLTSLLLQSPQAGSCQCNHVVSTKLYKEYETCSPLKRGAPNATPATPVRCWRHCDLQSPQAGRSQCNIPPTELALISQVNLQSPQAGRSQCNYLRMDTMDCSASPCSPLKRGAPNATPDNDLFATWMESCSPLKRGAPNATLSVVRDPYSPAFLQSPQAGRSQCNDQLKGFSTGKQNTCSPLKRGAPNATSLCHRRAGSHVTLAVPSSGVLPMQLEPRGCGEREGGACSPLKRGAPNATEQGT